MALPGDIILFRIHAEPHQTLTFALRLQSAGKGLIVPTLAHSG
jgi:hypothetical protein